MDISAFLKRIALRRGTASARKAFALTCRRTLLESPQWRGRFESAWLWSELDRDDDAGIDIVACDSGGGHWAIQAREWRGEPAKADVRLLLKESSMMRFEGRMLMCCGAAPGPDSMSLIWRSSPRIELFLPQSFAMCGLDWSGWRPAAVRGHPPWRLRCFMCLLSERMILEWADAYREGMGSWPVQKSGKVRGTTWQAVDDAALRKGDCGLAGGSSLAKLLAENRGRRNLRSQPGLTEAKILEWADKHKAETGKWPMAKGKAHGLPPEEKWRNVDNALRLGLRGLPGNSSLAKLLAERRGVRNNAGLPPLTEEGILEWADKHKAETGKWPSFKSGPVGDTLWSAVDVALTKGGRGLPGGSSLPKLLAGRRGVRNRTVPKTPLSEEKRRGIAA